MSKFWQFRNQADKKTGELLIYGDIESTKIYSDDVTPKEFKKELDALGEIDTLNIYINSGGGDVFAAQAIYSMLNRYKAKKTTYVDGLAASAASVIAMVGDKRIMPNNAMLMIHKAWSIAIGNADDFRKRADDLEKIEESIIAVYQEKSGIEREKVIELMAAETWMTAKEAKEYGFIDEIDDEKEVAACLDGEFLSVNGQKTDLSRYKNPPKMFVVKQEKPQKELDESQLLAFENAIKSKKSKYQEVK
jgi:ATP-dependent Clp protease protease subunit